MIGRELHEKLGIGKDYSNWFKDMCKYGFEEGESYSPFLANRSDGKPGKGRTEHLMKFDMAKHIAMIQRSEIDFVTHTKNGGIHKIMQAYSKNNVIISCLISCAALFRLYNKTSINPPLLINHVGIFFLFRRLTRL